MNFQEPSPPQARPSQAIRFTLIAAMFAVFFAAGWVMQYLITTDFGISYFMRPLSMFVVGQAYGLDGKGGDILFIVVTRFILGFGCLWLPIAGVMAFLSNLLNNRKTADSTATQPQPQTNQ